VEAPSDYPEFAQFLVELGLTLISLNPDSVLKTLIVAEVEAGNILPLTPGEGRFEGLLVVSGVLLTINRIPPSIGRGVLNQAEILQLFCILQPESSYSSSSKPILGHLKY